MNKRDFVIGGGALAIGVPAALGAGGAANGLSSIVRRPRLDRSLRADTWRHYVEIGDRHFAADMQGLLAAIRSVHSSATRVARPSGA